MSILNGPRLNFWGGISTDVSVPNNSATVPQNDDDGFQLFDPATSTIAPGAQSYSDEQLNEKINTPSSTAPTSGYTQGGWNHYGQHVVELDTQISSQGNPGSISKQGDLVGKPVYLLGSLDPVTGQRSSSGPMMVDLDPTSTVTTQIFVGGLQIGNNGDTQLLINCDTVCSSLDVKQRILGPATMDAPGSFALSGTFQLTFPRDSIVSYNQNSEALKSIIEAPGATGIVLRFVMFEMCPTLTTQQLNADYAARKYTPNPSIGRVIGTLAPAFADEPAICPAGRLLVNQDTKSTGFADLSNKGLLSIDMVNLIPKETFRADRTAITSPIGPNADYGLVSFCAGTTTLATLAPDNEYLQNYYLYGGIVDLPLDAGNAQQAKTQPLSLSAPDKKISYWPTTRESSLLIKESAYRLYTDQRNIYLEDHPDGLTIQLQVRYLGGPVPSDTAIGIAIGTSLDCLNYPTSVQVLANQLSVDVDITPKAGTEGLAGFSTLTYTLAGNSSYFSNFRKYSQTDFGIAAGSTITWDQMYPNVLRYHYLAFPAMSRYVPLNQPNAVMGAKDTILRRISDNYKGTTLYMPVVRSMSPSQRALLSAYLTGTPWQPLP
ncbi:hypothetical protein [Pseudomonas lijiangensis]|uniref:Uncharacterized protein n=1 Tax=Pseudomonas lijiangensis TaxID=2995658 RepID=A0ABX8HJV9_9PSED|nr:MULTISPECIES: hypothetical protein [Pseudomonas syringae group]MBX8488489.1 hypothetical protein [Pseudomonas cichorii]MBX8498491.1 hypothetical protein [Pseudomonas lijiangensis]MBX8503398.1 hypothetical protein [Pseudomonas lijiangensis]MBX8534372.1 hypothetical protein [Pseudomonas cichorii]MBX8544244.1 hypothetical protein [Pseudomonas cichorii]